MLMKDLEDDVVELDVNSKELARTTDLKKELRRKEHT